MASFWNGTSGGTQLKSLMNRMRPQTGLPNTNTPGGPQVGAPLGGPQTSGGGPANTGNPNDRITAGPNPLGGPITLTGQESRGGIPGAAGGPNPASTGQASRSGAGAGAAGAPGNISQWWQTSGGGPPNTGAGPGGQIMAGASYSSSAHPRPGAAGGAPGAGGYGTFSASDNLLGAQILPGTDPRQTSAQGYTDKAAAGLNAWEPKPFQSVSPYDPSGAYEALAAGNGQMQGMTTAGYRPVAGTDTSGASSWLDRAGQFANPSSQSASLAGAGGMGGFSYGAETGQSRTLGLAQLQKIMGDSPDRAKLAGDAYQLLLDREAPQAAADDRKLAQRTAALGRQGSGMFNSEQMDLATARERTRDQARRELANNAASLSLSDQLDKLGAAQGFSTAMGGLDTAAGSLNLGYQNANNAERGNAFDRSLALGDRAFSNARSMANDRLNLAQIGRNDALTERDAMNSAEQYGNSLTQAKANANRQYGLDTYGIGRDLYGDQVSERDKGLAYDQQTFNNLRSRFGDLTGYEQMVRGNGVSDRNEARMERGYQTDQDQRAIDNAVRQRQLEDQLFNSDANYANTLFRNGYSQDPYGALANAGNQAQGQASDAWGAAGDLFSNWARSRAIRPTTAPGRLTYGN